MPRQLRIRWNPEERAAVIRRAQTLAQTRRLSGTVLFKESQECLPMERRREPFANAVSWLKLELKNAGPLPSPVKIWRPGAVPQKTQQQGSASGEAPQGERTVGVAPVAAVTSVSPALETRSPALDHLIEMGVQLITGILSDARVKAAVAGLLGSTEAPAVLLPSQTKLAAVAPRPDSERREFVVVAGCSASEAKTLAKEVDGALKVRFWASDEPRERLLELLPRAEVVFGVADGIPKAVESSLSRLGERYVRHTGSVKGLYRRLAEQAMR